MTLQDKIERAERLVNIELTEYDAISRRHQDAQIKYTGAVNKLTELRDEDEASVINQVVALIGDRRLYSVLHPEDCDGYTSAEELTYQQAQEKVKNLGGMIVINPTLFRERKG